MSEETKKFPCGCSIPETYTPKNRRRQGERQFGDYLILKPDKASLERLSRLGALTQNKLAECGVSQFRPYDSEALHLTLVTPLRALEQHEVLRLMRRIQAVVGESGSALESDLSLSDPKCGGNHHFHVGGSSLSPYVTLRLRTDAPENGKSNDQAYRIAQIAEAARSMASGLDYVDKAKLANRGKQQLTPFRPHVTLGTVPVKDRDARLLLHKLQSHNQELGREHRMSHTLSVTWNKDQGTESLPISFSAIQLMRVDRVIGTKGGYHSLLANLDLVANRLSLFPMSGGAHDRLVDEKPDSKRCCPKTT